MVPVLISSKGLQWRLALVSKLTSTTQHKTPIIQLEVGRSHPGGQQTHGKTLTVPQRQGRTDQNGRVPPPTCQKGENSKDKKQPVLARTRSKGDLAHGWWGHELAVEEGVQGPRMVQNERPWAPATATGCSPETVDVLTREHVRTPRLTAMLLTTANYGGGPRVPHS